MADLSNRAERRELVSMIRTACFVGIVVLVLGGLAWNAVVGKDDPHAEKVTRADFEDFNEQWPLTVDEGTLRCRGAGSVTFEADGVEYAVNGFANGQHIWPDVDAIWASDPAFSDVGGKVNITSLIQRGLKLCES